MADGLSDRHKAYVRGEILASLLINSLLSLGFALLVAHGAASVPLWGGRGMAVDFVPQVFMIVFATTLAVTLLARKRVAAGRLEPLPVARRGMAALAPKTALVRAIVFAIAAAAILAPVSIMALKLLAIPAMAIVPFIVFKVVYGAVLSVCITPPIARLALRN